jgi:hypothetical protein
MHAESDDLQRGKEADRCTAEAVLHYNGRPATGPLAGGVVISAGRIAAGA